MKLTRTALRRTAASTLALPLALAGCGSGGAPEPPVASTTASAVPGPATPADGMPAQPAADERVAPEQSAESVRDGVRQTSAEVVQDADGLKHDASQAAGDAASGVKGFATELKADAQQSYNDAVGEARGEVQATVAGAKAKARNQVKAAADTARKQAADLGDKVLDDVFGGDAKAGKPN